jgi:hypothetical protein
MNQVQLEKGIPYFERLTEVNDKLNAVDALNCFRD